MNIPDGYYATPDPNNAEQMTYWRVKGGRISAWPSKAQYAPDLKRSDIPTDLPRHERGEWCLNWYRTHATPWYQAVDAAIAADPNACRQRFAEFTARCAVCGRKLTDAASKVYGIGPECRAGLADGVLTASALAIGQAHVEARANRG